MLKFSRDSSIHGIKFILNPNHNEFIKIFWIFSLFLSFCGFFYYIREAYIKLQFTPDIMMRTSEKLSSDFPMPAVTICPNLFARSDFVNVADIFNGNTNASKSQCEFLLANKIWCKLWSDNGIDNCGGVDTTKINVYELINDSNYDTEEAFWNCVYEADENNCENLSKILTPFGICYTINMQDIKDIFSDEVNLDNFLYTKKSTNKLQWTPEKKYENLNVEFPSRARKRNQFKLFPMVNYPDANNFCYQQFFTVIFHHPTEIPTTFHERFSINHNKEINFVMTVKSSRSDEYLRNFSPHYRKCYFENERKLKYFKIYSKIHCELECNVNQTLRKCGCAYIAMPMENSTKICHLNDFDCVKSQIESDLLKEGVSMLPCDCYPACNDVKYSFKMDGKELPKAEGERSDEIISTITIINDKQIVEEVENFVSYKLQNFVSDIGGLLGLFLGCSLLSIVEIFYYLIKFLMNFFKNETKNFASTNKIQAFDGKSYKEIEAKLLNLSIDVQRLQNRLKMLEGKLS